MLFVAPVARCPLTVLLKGHIKMNGLLCGCHVDAARHQPASLSHASDAVTDGTLVGAFAGEPPCIDHDVAQGDGGEQQLKRIEPSSVLSTVPKPVYIKVQVNEKRAKCASLAPCACTVVAGRAPRM